MIAGSWLRQLVMLNESFLLVLLFTIPISFGYPFLEQTSSKLAAVWFGDKEVLFTLI